MTVIDVAGATTGGAGRWRWEAQRWVLRHPNRASLAGLEQRVEPRWLARREFLSDRRRVAANNVSFLTGDRRVVLLRNHLQFLRPDERPGFPGLPNNLSRQARVVRAALSRAHVVVVPSTQMAERVTDSVPAVRDRIVVRHHPLSVRPRRESASKPEPYVLFPSLPAAHKDLDGALDCLSEAIEFSGLNWQIKVTATDADLGRARSSRIHPIGPQSLEQLEELLGGASAVFAPYMAESFGYPIAEGRAAGVPVVAPKTLHNQEVGGGALCAYRPDFDAEQVASALVEASKVTISPEPEPFDPDRYFTWLCSL